MIGPTAPSTHLSKVTGEYSIQLDYAGLTCLMDQVFEVWDSLKLDARDEAIGNGFERLVNTVAALRNWTGWGGIPEKYLGGNDL